MSRFRLSTECAKRTICLVFRTTNLEPFVGMAFAGGTLEVVLRSSYTQRVMNMVQDVSYRRRKKSRHTVVWNLRRQTC